MKLHVKYTETYPDTLPEFSIDMEEGDLEQEDFDTIMAKVTESVWQNDNYQMRIHRGSITVYCLDYLQSLINGAIIFIYSNIDHRLRRQ